MRLSTLVYVCLSLLSAQHMLIRVRLGSPTPGGGGGEPPFVLSASDIGSPIGCFIPPDPTGDSIDFGSGLALRYRSGTPYLYSTGQNGNVVEYSIPSDGAISSCLGGSPSWVTATATQQFGDIYQATIWSDHSNGGSNPPPYQGIPGGAFVLNGGITPTDLCWDDIDNRMYWNLMQEYDNSGTTSPTSLGYSTLDDVAHTGTGVAVWRISPIVSNGGYGGRWAGSCKVIPSVFQSQLGGRHLMVGPGGYHSIAAQGPISMGPAAFALDTTGLTGPTNRDYMVGLPTLPMQNHPYATVTPPVRTLRSNAIPTGLNLQSIDGVYYLTDTQWGWSDKSGGMVWVNGLNKRGVVFFTQLFAGDAQMVVQASPAPTHTTMAVDALGPDVRVGYVLRINTDTTVGAGHYNFSVAIVTNIDTSGANPILTFGSMEFGDASGADTTGKPIVGTTTYCGQGYQGAGNFFSGVWDVLMVYDPDDFVKVFNGTITADSVLFKSAAQLVVPSLTFPRNGGYSGTAPTAQPKGAVYDGVTHRLYVLYVLATNPGQHAQVVVYPVSD